MAMYVHGMLLLWQINVKNGCGSNWGIPLMVIVVRE